MEGTLRLIAWMERHAGPWGAAGGLLLFAYWNGLARDVALPGPAAVALQLATTALVTVAVVGHQLAQGTHPSSWVGWAGAAAVGYGFDAWPTLLCGGLVLLGLSFLRCGVHPRRAGTMLTAGAGVLLVATTFAPGFGTDNSVPMSTGWLLVMDAGLVLLGVALADLALAGRRQRWPGLSSVR